MKMFENVDSTATESGRDLWSEICSCLPNADQEDVSNAFSDSFVDSYPVCKDQGQAADFAVQSAIKPWAPLQDSEVYLASLEKKLRRIKGLNEEVTSKDMLRTLAQAKKECWDRFLQEKLASEFFVDGLDSDESSKAQPWDTKPEGCFLVRPAGARQNPEDSHPRLGVAQKENSKLMF
ncbi:coiled-coil domain-containing protein 32 isoform X2 [Cavia porcellus]|uniref:coiled-coil domain-containing protein 32 isoform X2 n=1 Tax=Cavia porcellus TaxID=10141 RepID=UPI000661B03B